LDHEVQPEWLSLAALAIYASVSGKVLRSWIHAANNPLPASQRGRKLYVHRRTFDQWMQAHQLTEGARMDRMVEEIVSELTEA
jgi:hypothetical protein